MFCSGACVEVRGRQWVSSIALHFGLLRSSLSQNQKLIDSAELAGHRPPGILLSPHLQQWDRHGLPCLPFTWGAGDLSSAPQASRAGTSLRSHLLPYPRHNPPVPSHISQLEDSLMLCLDGVCTQSSAYQSRNTHASRGVSPTQLFLGHKYEANVPNTKQIQKCLAQVE